MSSALTPRGSLREAVAAVGGTRAAAEIAGVSQRQVQRAITQTASQQRNLAADRALAILDAAAERGGPSSLRIPDGATLTIRITAVLPYLVGKKPATDDGVRDWTHTVTGPDAIRDALRNSVVLSFDAYWPDGRSDSEQWSDGGNGGINDSINVESIELTYND